MTNFLFVSTVFKCAQSLKVPITCKMRVFEDVPKTVQYAKMLEKAGAQVFIYLFVNLFIIGFYIPPTRANTSERSADSRVWY